MNKNVDGFYNAFAEVIYWTQHATRASIRDLNQGEDRRLEVALKDFHEELKAFATQHTEG